MCVLQARSARTGSVDAEEEVAHGLMTYFDKALPMLLLYHNERAQAADVSILFFSSCGNLLVIYFDKAQPMLLLYHNERAQAAD